MVTGLDNHDARWEAQCVLPRILIDGAIGRDMVARVERVEIGGTGASAARGSPHQQSQASH